ncbi:hypothetical protein JG687_00000146 [Phytophthora cactorum]|uniref:Uncharacterized protein n=1 Tax=Phytophthora cactorum TaxID=29920 RepID=A0A329T344_9STRA|nr:hypothetical protein PC112_g2477 [Phytophthora cactorum]KAG2845917.1 hypothetical protein PC111_g1373 [Phytophthora cactorum]KAG3204078.1 hypothetical protein PC128_g2164 [Phytophthora cactorum]KAG4249745.1 hypothetical protein PC116_g2523 [Phytophthora cactorum]KAG6974805.1 hypothetical protein JG687_00000146 [Phytophthora cactorum]
MPLVVPIRFGIRRHLSRADLFAAHVAVAGEEHYVAETEVMMNECRKVVLKLHEDTSHNALTPSSKPSYASREEQDRAEHTAGDKVRRRRNRDTTTPVAEGASVAVPVFTAAGAVVSTWQTLADVRRAVLGFSVTSCGFMVARGSKPQVASKPVCQTP